MSYYSKDQFEYTFALRTAYNYKHIKDTVKKFKEEGVDEETYKLYEVTQLINSFLGLLLLPHEKYYKYLSTSVTFKNKDSLEVLNKINIGESRVIDTYLFEIEKNHLYREKSKEEKHLTAYELTKRLRDAAAHGGFRVYPEKFEHNTSQITHLTFYSSKKLRGYWTDGDQIFCIPKKGEIDFNKQSDWWEEKFEITLSIEEVEILLFAICRLLVSCQDNGNVRNWPKDLELFG